MHVNWQGRTSSYQLPTLCSPPSNNIHHSLQFLRWPRKIPIDPADTSRPTVSAGPSLPSTASQTTSSTTLSILALIFSFQRYEISTSARQSTCAAILKHPGLSLHVSLSISATG